MSSNSSTREKRRRNKKSFISSSPIRPARPTRSFSPPPSATSLLDHELLVEELSLFEDLQIWPENPNPRCFPYSVKQQCWQKAEKIKGRDADRWRRDPLGNIVFKKLVGCPGCLCHDYDHIVPYSKVVRNACFGCSDLVVQCASATFYLATGGYNLGSWLLHYCMFTSTEISALSHGGKSTLENCQVLQATVNRSKGNRAEMSKGGLMQKSAYCRVSGRDMDLLELTAYGNVRRGQDSGGCKIQ